MSDELAADEDQALRYLSLPTGGASIFGFVGPNRYLFSVRWSHDMRRRAFLVGSLAAGGGLLAATRLIAAPPGSSKS